MAAGSGTITQTAANALLIRQATDRLAINWQSFSIGAGNSVRFEQPSVSSIALNRVLGTSRSEIFGNLSANGQVFLLNPNGVLFGRTAQVDVGGIVATTLKLTDRDFLDGRFIFNDSNSAATITNEGDLRARDGGYLALIANRVVNHGSMEAHRGSVVLGAGGSARLTLADNRLVSFEVTQGALDALAENGGLIRANGGQVIMTAGARDSLLASVVNNSGVIEAQTVERQPGNVLLLSGMAAGTTTVGGRIDASAPAALNPDGGDGGFVETSGAHVKVADGARIDRRADNGRAGTWLIDPKDHTIAATGGDISGATLSANLSLGDVSIQSSGGGAVGGNAGSGDVNVNDAVSWNANRLTLTAARDININAVMTAGGTSTLALNTGTANGADAAVAGGRVKVGFDSNWAFRGRVDFVQADGVTPRSGTGMLNIDGNAYTVLTELGAQGSTTSLDLQGITGSPSVNYALGANIDASATATWNSGAGFLPITTLVGNFNGLGHVISNLILDRPLEQEVGMFVKTASTSTQIISNVGLEGGYTNGAVASAGRLLGKNQGAEILNSYATGAVTGTAGFAGGLIGSSSSGSSRIINSYATGAVSGSTVGGLAGRYFGDIKGSHATGEVNGTDTSRSSDYINAGNGMVGGLVGRSFGNISNSFATGNVQGFNEVGGLVGHSGNIADSYATGNVNNPGYKGGGLVGIADGAITRSYATGNVTGGSQLGGLAGRASSVSDSYATGNVSGLDFVGGLIGVAQEGNILRSHATGQVSGRNAIGGLVGCLDIGRAAATACVGTIGGFVTSSYATGDVSATGDGVGGLIGQSSGISTVRKSYASGSVSGRDGVGGLAGQTDQYMDLRLVSTGPIASLLTVSESYASGAVSGRNGVGGMIGQGWGIFLTDTYSTGNVSGINNVGGLVGYTNWSGGATLTDAAATTSYATGNVTGVNSVGGLIGRVEFGVIVDSYASGTVSGSTNVDPVVGYYGVDLIYWNGLPLSRSPAVMTRQAAFDGFDFGSTWLIYEGHTSPLLRAFLTPLIVPDTTLTYNATTQSASPSGLTNVFGTWASGRNASSTAYLSDLWSNQQGYNLSGGRLFINQVDLPVTGLSASNKTYDTTTAAALTGTATITALGLDDVILGGTAVGAFANKTAGTGKAVTVTGNTISGADAANYRLVQQTGLTANIGQADLAVSGLSASNKTYDATTVASLTGSASVTALGLDDVTVGGTAVGAFASKTVGTGKAVTVTGNTISGADAANYRLVQQTGLTANIGQADLAVTGLAASNKTYDTTTAAALTGTASVTALGLDNVTVGGTAVGAFASKTAGTGKVVTVTGNTISGTDAANYRLVQQTGLTANIGQADLVVTGLAASNKTYDATTAAALTGTATITPLGLDNVTVGGTAVGAFGTKTVGTGKAVTVTGNTIIGADAANYRLVQQAGLTANITPADLVVSGLLASNKTYDATTVASLTGTATVSTLGSDVVTLGGTAVGTFADKNAGTGKAVTVTGNTLGGADAGNYTLRQAGGLTADIGAKALSIGGIAASNKTYDGTTSATVNTSGATYTGLVSGDAVTVSATGAFANKNVGIGKTVNLASSYSGADVTNYSITDQASTSADIGAKALTIGGITASSKTYDGTAAATVSTAGATYNGLVSGDAVTVSATGAFANKNVGAGKAVTLVSSYAGADAGNYAITDQASTTASISAKPLTVGGITAASRTYDGTTSVTISTSGATYTGLISGDAVTVSATGAFGDKNVGVGKAVTLATSYTGADTGNYSITNQASTTADISAKALTVGGITAANRTYDGTTAATVSTTGATYAGLVSGDAVTVSATGAFGDKNVGNGKSVTLASSYTGADVLNYSISNQASTTADINAKALTVGGITAANRTYDGATAATLSTAGATYGGLISGDAVSVSATGTFANKNVGIGKTVTLASSYTGPDVGNYSITNQASTTADIIAKALSISGITAANRTYDGTTSATVSTAGATYTGLVSGDAVTVNATGAFGDKNAGLGKTVSLVTSHVGADVSNYAITSQTSTSADIAPRALTVTALDARKTYGSTYSFAGTDFSATGLAIGDRIDAVALTSAGAAAGATVAASPYAIQAGAAQGANFLSGNYNVTYVPGNLAVDPATLLVSARPLTRTIDGTAFSGGNGVDYLGFANGESANALGGLLSYGGSAQGASNLGRYLIVPGGLTAANYSISYRAGELIIDPVPTTRAVGAQAAIAAVQSSLGNSMPVSRTNGGEGTGGGTQGNAGTGNLPSIESLSELPPPRSGPRTRVASLFRVVGSGQNFPEGVE